MIESKLAPFEMQIKLLFPQPFELRQPILCKAPKDFDPVDVTATTSDCGGPLTKTVGEGTGDYADISYVGFSTSNIVGKISNFSLTSVPETATFIASTRCTGADSMAQLFLRGIVSCS